MEIFCINVNKIWFLSIRGGDMTQYMPTACLPSTHALLNLHKQITQIIITIQNTKNKKYPKIIN